MKNVDEDKIFKIIEKFIKFIDNFKSKHFELHETNYNFYF